MRKYLKKTVAIPLLIITIIFAGTSCQKTEPTNPTPPATLNPAVSKDTAQKPTNLVPGVTPVSAVVPVKILESPGKIVFPDKVRVQFETAGTVERVMVDEAVRVRKGDALVSLDSVTVTILQKQVAAARVALDDAEEALKDEKERYIPGDLIARQARITQLQKEMYILQQILDDSLEFYQDKAKDLLGVTVPLALLDRPPEQLVAALLSQIGVKPFWGAFQDHVRPKLEVHWEQINRLQDQGLQLQQTLRNIQQQKDDITSGYSETKAQAALQVIQKKTELTLRQRDSAILQRDGSLVQLEQLRIAYRNQIRDLLGLSVTREMGNGFYIHFSKGTESSTLALEEEMTGHIKLLMGMNLDSRELTSLSPEKLVVRLVASSEGQDHVLDYLLLQKAQGAWLSLSQARQKVDQRNLIKTQTSDQYLRALTQGGNDETAPWRKAFRDLQIAELELQTAIQARDQSLIAYKQIFRDYLNVDLDKTYQITVEEQSPEILFKLLRPSIIITERLQQEMVDNLRTSWAAIQQTEIAILKSETTVQESDLSIQEAKEGMRQVQNTLNDLTTKTNLRRLEAQEQTVLVQQQQAQDKLKKSREDYQKVMEDYLDIPLQGKFLDQPPVTLLQISLPEDKPGFRKYLKDVTLEGQGPWGQLQQAREQSGIIERALKKAKEDLDDAKKGPNPLVVALKESEVVQARKQYEDAQRKLNLSTVKAPFDGIVTRVLVDPGDYIEDHKTLLEIINPDKVEVEAILDELDVVRLSPGMTVKVKLDAYPDKQLAGSIISIEPLSQTSGFAVQYRARVKFEANPTLALYENMSAHLSFESADKATPR